MASPLLVWPNAEKHAIEWVRERTGHNTWTETPANLTDDLPAHQVQRIGGGELDAITKVIQIEVATFAATRGDLWDAVAAVETAMYALTANGTADWYVDAVTTTFAAAIEPYENGDVRKATAVFGLAVRPRTTTTP